jgi:hypothetical protein
VRALLLAVVFALTGCRSHTPNSAGGAAIMTGIALASSGVSRAMGGCYAQCTAGTVCNQETGLCDPLPCNGSCEENERCDPLTNECVHDPAGDITVGREQTAAEREEDPHKPERAPTIFLPQ